MFVAALNTSTSQCSGCWRPRPDCLAPRCIFWGPCTRVSEASQKQGRTHKPVWNSAAVLRTYSILPVQRPVPCCGPAGVGPPPLFLRPNSFTLGAALPQVLGNTPAKCEVDRMNGSGRVRRTDTHTGFFALRRVCGNSLKMSNVS